MENLSPNNIAKRIKEKYRLQIIYLTKEFYLECIDKNSQNSTFLLKTSNSLPPTPPWAKGLNRHYTKDIKTVNKHMIRSFITREMQIKTTTTQLLR